MSPVEQEACPVYNCDLAPELHDPVDPEAGFDCAPDSLWHANSTDGVCWPEPLIPVPYEPGPPAPIYGPYEERTQRETRERVMGWMRSDWHSSLEDLIFQATMLGSPASFSGDHRPIAAPSEGNSKGTP